MFSVPKAMFLYEKECRVSPQVRTFAAMNAIIAYITGHAAEFIVGAAVVAAFVWLYWLVWRTANNEHREEREKDMT